MNGTNDAAGVFPSSNAFGASGAGQQIGQSNRAAAIAKQ